MAEDSTQPPHTTRFVETTRGILSYAQLAPLLADRVLRALEDIEDDVVAARPLDESLLLDLHEILRRLELPPVELASADETARKKYVQALEAADRLDWTPLTKLWQERLEGP